MFLLFIPIRIYQSLKLKFSDDINLDVNLIQMNRIHKNNMTQILQIDIRTNDQMKVADKSIDRIDQDATQQPEPQTIGFFAMFRFASRGDIILMIVGSICACLMGVALPAFAILWGNMTDQYGITMDQMVNQSRTTMLQFIYIGIGALFAGWGMFACWMIAGQRQGITCRKEYLKSLLKQQIGWFDLINQSELATKFATDCFAFQGAIGQKVSTLMMTISMFIAGVVIALIYGWTMTLVVLAGFPAIGYGGYLYASASGAKAKGQQEEYAVAGGQVEQAIAAIKTVKQLNGEQFEAKKYEKTLVPVTKASTKYGAYLGLGLGAMFGTILASYSLGFWYGSLCVQGASGCPPSVNGGTTYKAGTVLIVFFSILMSGFNLSQLTPAIKKISEGRIAAARIYKVIDRKPLIESKENSIIPKQFKGVIKFEGVTFAYPKDKSKKILQNLNLQINSTNSAFVGQSGCGKSTIFQLIMRFYDPDQGRITIDGIDIKQLNLDWLRNQIGYVGQQPVLFATTIKENLLFGREDATDEEIDQALKKAEAYGFVNKLKEGLLTYVGTGGGQISGGQKQRLAIARAILKNPKILLLDEATSALDRRNQKLIQGTLNKIAEQKITITIAHRVKTIMSCQQIFVMDSGKLAEQGRFRQLQRYKDVQMEEDQQATGNEFHLAKQNKNQKQKNQQVIITSQKKMTKEEEDQLKEKKKKQEEQQLLNKYKDSIFKRLFGYCSDKIGYFICGIIVCILNGFVFPVFSIFLAKMLAVLVKFGTDPSQARTDSNLYALIFLIIAIGAFILNFLQQTLFSYIGEHLTEKVRNQTYFKILKMPGAWFDKPKNSSGALSARLASDCSTVNGLMTTFISIFIQSLTTLISGIVIAFIYEWRTSLVALGMLPLMIISGAVQMAFTQGFSDKTDKAYKDSANLITQSMINIRTVTSFGSEDIVQRKFSSRLQQPLQIGIRKGMVSGFLYGMTQIVMFTIFGLIFFLGVVFMRDNNLQIENVFTAIYSILFAGMTAGNNSHFMPDIAAAKISASNIFQILDSQDEDQKQIAQNSKLLKVPIKGHIVFKNVSFKYESRDYEVFKNLNLQIKQGQKVGFVGPSGCGKSTVFQLIQRFYQPTQGEIIIDGENIKDYDIHYLRSSLGIVSQEPVLFNDTIGENIKYNRENTTKEEISAAADQSNFNPEKDKIQVVHTMTKKKTKKQEEIEKQIQKHMRPDGTGFDKNVGVKGSHISGGQKQRVAIARVVLRRPNVLLLDEATSALDRINEQKVQESLDRMMKGKTSLTIAHRIDTIKNSDNILVFHLGQIVESGTFNDLMAKKGKFYNLEKGLQLI